MVDPGDDAPRILDAIWQLHLHITHILLTHAHFDHMLAVREIAQATGADLLVPLEDEPALADSKLSLVHKKSTLVSHPLKADRLLSDGDTVEAGELVIHVLHTPGHTRGSSCYQCENLLLTGDTLFHGCVGRTDFPGGSMRAMAASMSRLSQLKDDYTVLPGHKTLTTLSQEKRYNPYMVQPDRDDDV